VSNVLLKYFTFTKCFRYFLKDHRTITEKFIIICFEDKGLACITARFDLMTNIKYQAPVVQNMISLITI